MLYLRSRCTPCAACARHSFRRPFQRLRRSGKRPAVELPSGPGFRTNRRDVSRIRASSTDGEEMFRERRFKEFTLQSREAVLRAVEQLGNSATAAEVAAKAALPVQEAEKLLQALAIDGAGSLKVCCVIEPSQQHSCCCWDS